MSDKEIIIHLDNDESILRNVKKVFDGLDIDLELYSCKTEGEFLNLIQNKRKLIRCIIFDLLGSTPGNDELHEDGAAFLKFIEMSLESINVPIFIYSGFLDNIENKFNGMGTVYKVDKEEGIKGVFNKIKLFQDSGFLNVFCPGGKIEEELHIELNKAFLSQFTNHSQIEDIINTIISTSESKKTNHRVERVFTRIAVRSLLSGLKNIDPDDLEGDMNDEFYNPAEHYLQRISPFKILTGDIFKSNENNDYVLIMTPRCDLINKEPEDILICEIDTNDFPDDTSSNTKKRKIRDALNDNPTYAGYNRYLARSPFFVGGLVILSRYKMLKRDHLLSNYSKIVSLSEELTNEILGKFGSYFFRTGITTWSLEETVNFLNNLSNPIEKE